MNAGVGQDDTKHRVDAKIDAAVEKLNALSAQIDSVAERLAREDEARVRKAFQERNKGSHDGG